MNREVGSKGIYPNVDFYSATTYFSLGIDFLAELANQAWENSDAAVDILQHYRY